MATSSYYVPDSSYFPIVASFGLIGMAAGGGGAPTPFEVVVDRACQSGNCENLTSERVTENRPQQRHRPNRRLSCNVSHSSRL